MVVTKILLIFALITILQFPSIRSDSLSDFVSLKLENYTAWLKANHLDPTPLQPGPQGFEMNNLFINLDVDTRNFGVRGHSEDLEIKEISSNLEDGDFAIWYSLKGNITILGEHNSSGMVVPETPLNGEGSWQVSTSELHCYCAIHFVVLPDGYLMVQVSYRQYKGFDVDKIYFENLSDNDALVGYEEYFNDPFSAAFKRFWMQPTSEPILLYMVDYWKEILSETTLADIIGTTTRPPTSTSDWYTTTTSNPCQVFGVDKNEISLKGKIVDIKEIDKITKVDANGVRKLITKTVITTEQEL